MRYENRNHTSDIRDSLALYYAPSRSHYVRKRKRDQVACIGHYAATHLALKYAIFGPVVAISLPERNPTRVTIAEVFFKKLAY